MKTLRRNLWMLAGLAVMMFVSCGDEEETPEPPKGTIAKVLTNDVTQVGGHTATCGGYVTSDGENTVTARGVCYGKEPNPTISGDTTMDGQGVGSYTSNIRGLEPNTLYYVRAYATNARGTAYGSEHDFTTTEATGGRTPSGYINGRGYVDLGLSVKWATANIGAADPSDVGNYYAWGEIQTKDEYTTANSKTYAKDIGDIKGNPDYDVAKALWGSTWRMPTRSEMAELRDSCEWLWTTQDGASGVLIIGKNGNSIFLPAAGFIIDATITGVSTHGFYWSSQPYETEMNDAYYLYFNASARNVDWSGRQCGHTVRPVSK